MWEHGLLGERGCQGSQKQTIGERLFFLGTLVSCEIRFRIQGGKLGHILNLFLFGSMTLN